MLPIFDEERDWTPKQDLLRNLLKNANKFEEAITLALELHALTHLSEMSSSKTLTFGDEVWNGLCEEDFSIMPTIKDVTIAWNVWHITRIEDLVANLLIQGSNQVLNNEWLRRLNVSMQDTGNAMSDKEINDFSKEVNKPALKDYRNAVGRKTIAVLKTLVPEDIKRKPTQENLDKLVSEGGLLEKTSSIWLRDFWGKKTIGGLILLPITKHQIMHLTDCVELKTKLIHQR